MHCSVRCKYWIVCSVYTLHDAITYYVNQNV